MLVSMLAISANVLGQSTNTFPQTGDVGIGTTLPSARLHVVGDSKLDGNLSVIGDVDLLSDFRIRNLSVAGSPKRLLGISQDGKVEPMESSTGHLHYLEVDSGIKVGDSSIYIMHSNANMPYNQFFATNGPLYINLSPAVPENTLINSQTGQVGIGYFNTNLPIGAKFSVYGNSYFSGFNGINTALGSNSRLAITANSSETALEVRHLQATANGIAFRDIVSHPLTKAFTVEHNGAETFRVLGNGVTNISGPSGAYNLTAQLYVESGLDIGCRVKSTNPNAGKIAYLAEVPRLDTRAISVVYNDNNPGTADPENFVVTGAGTVKVGQSSNPINAQVMVETGLNAGIAVRSKSAVANPNQVAYLAEVQHTQTRAISVVNTNPTNYPIPREVFRVDGNGVAWMQELRVRVAPFPDYVFEKEYQLMDLDSLELYIQENHRLPGMPSAEEVEKDYANVGELVRLQQEKIEELTLYVIDLKKEISGKSNCNK